MTTNEKNSADLNFSKKEEELLQRIELAILDKSTAEFKKNLGKTCSSKPRLIYNFKKIAAIFFAVFTLLALAYYFTNPANKRLYNNSTLTHLNSLFYNIY